MPKTIDQSVTFPVKPGDLYATYLSSTRHAAIIGHKVSVSKKVGSKFIAFGGSIQGKMLALVPNRMIVQSWRGAGWEKNDPDSVLVLLFSKAQRGGKIQLVHANVPDHQYRQINNGWKQHYWKPWKKYVKSSRRK